MVYLTRIEIGGVTMVMPALAFLWLLIVSFPHSARGRRDGKDMRDVQARADPAEPPEYIFSVPDHHGT